MTGQSLHLLVFSVVLFRILKLSAGQSDFIILCFHAYQTLIQISIHQTQKQLDHMSINRFPSATCNHSEII